MVVRFGEFRDKAVALFFDFRDSGVGNRNLGVELFILGGQCVERLAQFVTAIDKVARDNSLVDSARIWLESRRRIHFPNSGGERRASSLRS